MTIKDFFFKGKKGTGSKKQKKSIKPTVEEFEALGPDPSPKAVMKRVMIAVSERFTSGKSPTDR